MVLGQNYKSLSLEDTQISRKANVNITLKQTEQSPSVEGFP